MLVHFLSINLQGEERRTWVTELRARTAGANGERHGGTAPSERSPAAGTLPAKSIAKQPNIVVFFWDNLGWGEVGCYGGGILRGAPTPRIDRLAAEGLRLLNFNVEAQCTPSRSALLTGRHPIRSGTQTFRSRADRTASRAGK